MARRTKEEQEAYERAFEDALREKSAQREQIKNRTQNLLAQRVARDEQARMNAAVQQEPTVSQVQNEAQWPGGITLPGTFGANAENMYSLAFEAPDIAQQTRTQPKSQYEQMNAVKQAWDASDPAATNRVMNALKNSQVANAPENTNRLYRAALLSSQVPDRETADKELSDSLAALSQSTGLDTETLRNWAERMQNPDELAKEMEYYSQNEQAMKALNPEEQTALRQAAAKVVDVPPVTKNTPWSEIKDRREAQQLIDDTAQRLGISAKSLANYLQRLNNAEKMADVEQTSRELGEEHPILSSVGSVATSVAGRLPSALDYGMQYLRGKLGDEYLPIDTNTQWQILPRATSEVRGQVSEDLEEAVQDATGNEGLGSAASLVYNAGLSGVDSMAQAALLGGNPVLVGIGAGAGSFSDTVTSAKEKGASDSQAMAAGVASGVAESLFEQISLGNLKAMAKVNPKGLRDVVLNFGKSLAVEGSEEAMTEAANIVADAIIMGDVSDYNIAKNAWMEAGYSAEEAEKQAMKELIARVAMAGAGGMIMGAGTSGAGMAYSAANTYNTGRQINQSGNLGELIGQGLSTDAASDAYTQAAQLAQKQLEGSRIGNYETGRLANDLAMWRNAEGVFMPPLPQNVAQTPGVFNQAAQQRALEEAKVTEDELSAIERMASDKGLNVEYVYDTTSGVDGFVQGNTITVNLASDSASFGTAVHEIGHSMRQANEAQYVKFQNAVLRMAEQDAVLSEYADKVRSMYTAQNSPALQSLLNEDGTVNSAALDEEVSLKLAEQIVSDPQKLTEAVSGDRGLMATFLDFVRGIKNSIAIKLTNSQKAMLDEAERTLVNLLRGEAGNVDGTRYSIEKDGKERYDNFKPFGEQVDDAVNGRMPRANDLLMGETPQVLQKVGLNALPMTMTARHAQTIYNSNGQDQNANYHGLGELLKQLPEAMQDPVAVIRSETRRGNSVVVLADLKDQSGNSVVVPVRVDGYGRLNGVEIDANAAASAYGKKNAVAGLLKNALAAEAQGEVGVYYINKNKAMSPSLAAGVQFPGGVHGLDGFIHSIHEQKADVNTSLPDATGSKQFKRWFGDWQKSPTSASKIVDAEGKPLVMYHGTRAENGNFAVFDADKAVKKGGLGMKAMGKGNYFTSTKLNGTERYGSRVIPAYLNIRKPFIYEGGKSFKEQVGEVLHTDTSEMNHDELQALLRRNGYDGVVQRNKEGDINIAVAFDSDQIKSADRNIGTFEKNDPNIYHSLNIPYSLPDGRSLREYLNEQYRGEPITWTDETTGKRMQMEQAENGASFPPINAEEPAAAVPGMVTEEAVQSKAPELVQSMEQEDSAWEQYMPNGWQNLPIEQQIALSERAQKRAEQAAAEQPITQQTVKQNTQGKAQRVQASKTNQFVNTVGDALSVPKGARREFLAPIAQKVAQEMKQTGTVSKESADKLFETAYRQGVVVDEEYYNTYKELKDELRTTAVTLDRESRNSAEYKDIRTRYFGSLKMTNDGGTPVDVKYAELAQRYPELFDEELTSPLDQLERLGEVAKSIQKVGYELDAYYAGDEDFKKYSRFAFDDAIEKMRQDMRLVSRYETDRAAQREKRNQPAQPEPMDEQKAMAIYRQVEQLQKNAEKTVSRELLTEEDQHTVERLLKGDMDIRDLKGENAAAIRRVYEAKKAVQDTLAPVQEYNRQKKEALRLEAEKDVEKSDAWKDKGWGLGYSLETMERNIRDIVPDRAEAERIIKKYFVPIHENEAKATRWKNELRQEIRELKLTQIESEYLQIYGEMRGAEIAARMGHKRSEAELEYLSKAELAWKEKYGNRMDMGKINRALKVFNKNYDMIFPQMNEAYVRNGYAPVEYRMGYFPHFSDNKPDGLVARIAQRLGFNPTNDNLPTDIAGLTYSFRPGRKWFGNIKQRTGFETTYDAVKGFDRYVETAADVIFHTDDIQRLRALEDALRWRNSAEGVKEQAQAIRDDDRLTEDQKAILLHDLYSKGKSHLSNFVQELNEYTNRLAGKKSIHDRSVEADAGRQIYQTMADLESRVAANMVAVNPGSWLTNFIPITQASAETSTSSLIRAAHDTVKAYLVDDGFADTSTFLTNRRGSDPLSRTTVQKLSSILTKPMTYIDDFTSSVVTRAKYLDNVKAGLDAESAMQDADRFAASIMADRSKGALPTIFERKNPLTRLFTMYQVEVNNQLRYLVKDLPDSAKEKGLGMLIAGLLKYTIGAYLFNDLYELLVGRRPALDFLGIANEAIGDATGYQLPNTVEAAEAVLSGEKVDFTTEKKGVSDAAAGVAENVAESLPFIGGLLGGGRVPISSALPDIATVSSNALGMMNGEKDSESAWQAIGKELAKPAYYLLPPMGGGQIKKAIEGITTVAQGGQYGTDSSGRRRLKFAVDDPTLGTYAQAAIFGPYSLPTAQEYVNSGFKMKSADYTQAREAAKERNISGEQFDEWWNRMDLNADGQVTEKEAVTSLPHLNGVADSTKAFLWSQTAGDTSLEGYRAAQDNGVGNEYFQMRMEADQDKPGESGYGSISSTEMKDWLRQQELGLDKQAALWKTMATYDQQYDYATAQRQGVGDLYVDLLLNADQLYGDGNGYLNKAEIMAYLDAAQLELDVKRLLFGMVSSAKNPY